MRHDAVRCGARSLRCGSSFGTCAKDPSQRRFSIFQGLEKAWKFHFRCTKAEINRQSETEAADAMLIHRLRR